MIEESNRNRVSIRGNGKEVFSTTNFEVSCGVHLGTSYSLSNHFSSSEGKETEGEPHLPPQSTTEI